MTEHEQLAYGTELSKEFVRILPLPVMEDPEAIIGVRLGVLISLVSKHTLELTSIPDTLENNESLAIAIRSCILDWLGRHSPSALN